MHILFVAEAVTLAHLARPLALLEGLLSTLTEVHSVALARPPSHVHFVSDSRIRQYDITSLPAARFLAALASGQPVMDADLMAQQVREDRILFDAFQPDLVVGDFRLSLSISARQAGLPYTTVSNAYWSPFSDAPYPMPVLPITRRLPLPLARWAFRLGRRPVMALHTRALNTVRQQHGFAVLGGDLRRAYTDADHVLYADDPHMHPCRPLPANHHFIGPLVWAPPVPDPPWWGEVGGAGRPVVYVNLGSSGSLPSTVQTVVDALGELPCEVMLATAGAESPASPSPKLRTARYLHGSRASARSQLVICNGGSLACQQALMAGCPILGIASNMDQFFNMAPIVEAGAGICLRADRLTPAAIRRTVSTLLAEPSYRSAARLLGESLQALDAQGTFRQLLPSLARRP